VQRDIVTRQVWTIAQIDRTSQAGGGSALYPYTEKEWVPLRKEVEEMGTGVIVLLLPPVPHLDNLCVWGDEHVCR